MKHEIGETKKDNWNNKEYPIEIEEDEEFSEEELIRIDEANKRCFNMKNYILLIRNKKTGEAYYETDCLHSSVEDLKKFYEDFEHLEVLRAWVAEEVTL